MKDWEQKQIINCGNNIDIVIQTKQMYYNEWLGKNNIKNSTHSKYSIFTFIFLYQPSSDSRLNKITAFREM